MALCECKEAALCETGETKDVTLEGRVCFDFLKAEDVGASESWRHRSHADGLPCKEAAPGTDRLPLSAQHLYQLPHKRSGSSRSHSLHKQSICF